jgi:hypothetical protein
MQWEVNLYFVRFCNASFYKAGVLWMKTEYWTLNSGPVFWCLTMFWSVTVDYIICNKYERWTRSMIPHLPVVVSSNIRILAELRVWTWVVLHTSCCKSEESLSTGSFLMTTGAQKYENCMQSLQCSCIWNK